MKQILIIITALLALAEAAWAGPGGTRSPFAIGQGARQLGMGAATVAIANGANSVYWNPAGLAFLDRSEIQLFHMSLFMATRYEFITAAYPTLSTGVFAAAVGDLSSGDFDRIDNYITQGSFSSRQSLLILGYGFAPIKNLATGIAIKGVYYDLAGFRDTGFGFDVGLHYSPPFLTGFSAGFKASEIGGPRLKLRDIEQRFPWSVRGGVAYQRALSEKYGLLLDLDIENAENIGTDVYAGAEFGYNDNIFARAGYMADKVTLGLGVSYANFGFDYAYAGLSDLGTSHRLSLSFTFGPSIKERIEQRDQAMVSERVAQIRQQDATERRAKIEQTLIEAREFESQGKIYEASEAYYRVLGLDDQNEEARSKIATLLEKIKLEIAREASRGYFDNLVARQLELADGYMKKNQYDNAAEQYRLALLLDPQNAQAQQNLAEIDIQRRNESTALKTQIQNHMRAGEYQTALIKTDQVLALNAQDSQALQTRATIYKIIESAKYLDLALRQFDSANYEQSLALVDSALALNPGSAGGQSLKRQLARYTAKQTTLEDIKKNDAHWQIYIQGMEKYQAGEYDQALQLWQSLQEYYPNNPNLKRNIEQAAERSAQN